MKFLQPEGIPFKIAGQTFEVSFNVNVMVSIYEKYNSTEAFKTDYNEAIKDTKNPMRMTKMLAWIASLLVNDAIEAANETAAEKTAKITETQMMRLLKAKDVQLLKDVIIAAWNDSMDVVPTEADDDDAPTQAELEAEQDAEGEEEKNG